MWRENLPAGSTRRYIGTIDGISIEAVTRIRHYQEEQITICEVILCGELWTHYFEIGPDLDDFEILKVAKRQIERVVQGPHRDAPPDPYLWYE